MEVMDMSLDKFYHKVYKLDRTIPEEILGKIAVAVSGVFYFSEVDFIFVFICYYIPGC